MKPKIAVLLALLLILSLFAACSAAGSASGDRSLPGPVSEEPEKTGPAAAETAPAGDTLSPMDPAAETEVRATEETDPVLETEIRVTGETAPAPEPVPIDLEWDRPWRTGMELAPGEEGLVRELVIGYDEHTYTFRCGYPFSEFGYWAGGAWELDGDELRLTVLEAEEGWVPFEGAEAFEAVYAVERSGDSLILTLRSEQGFPEDRPGEAVVYTLYLPEE